MRCTPDGAGARYDQRAVFFPSGLSGRLYWLAVLSFHGFIFAGMANRITAAAALAEKASAVPLRDASLSGVPAA